MSVFSLVLFFLRYKSKWLALIFLIFHASKYSSKKVTNQTRLVGVKELRKKNAGKGGDKPDVCH